MAGKANLPTVGSDRVGKAAATYYGLVESWKNHGINPLTYLADVLSLLPGCKTVEDYQYLIPSNCFKNNIGR